MQIYKKRKKIFGMKTLSRAREIARFLIFWHTKNCNKQGKNAVIENKYIQRTLFKTELQIF